MLNFLIVIASVVVAGFVALLPFFLVLWCGERVLHWLPFGRPMRFLLIMVKSLRRNLTRTSLTYLATFVLVIVVTMVWSTLYFFDSLMTERTKDMKIIVTEKWEAFSQMPFSYAAPLSEGAYDSTKSDSVKPTDSMTWQYFIGQLGTDKGIDEKKSRDEQMFFIALEPSKLLTMMDELMGEFRPAAAQQAPTPTQEVIEEFRTAVARMEHTKMGVIIGKEKLKTMNRQIGDRFHVKSTNYAGLDLEFEVVGHFPDGRYEQFSVMRRDYLNDALEAYPRSHGGQKHGLADKSLNVVWLKVPNPTSYNKVSQQIESSGQFQSPAVKCETLASAIVGAFEGFKDIAWAVRWLLSPAILIVMALVLCNSISISVRERRTEMAVLKVLGYRPSHLVILVLGEAILIGAAAGAISAALTYWVTRVIGQTADLGPLMVPGEALWWGPGLGAATAIIGCFGPALSGCRVKVAEVFSKVA
jgi:putative ABC transport system permease protein